MFNPCEGKETKSSIFLFLAASNLFKWKQRTFGSVANVCCFFVGVFLEHAGQLTGSPKFSGDTKCSRQVSKLSCTDAMLFVACSLSTSSERESETFRNSSLRFLFVPHSLQRRTELKDPSKMRLEISAKSCRESFNKDILEDVFLKSYQDILLHALAQSSSLL